MRAFGRQPIAAAAPLQRLVQAQCQQIPGFCVLGVLIREE